MGQLVKHLPFKSEVLASNASTKTKQKDTSVVFYIISLMTMNLQLVMMMQACNSSAWKAESGGPQV
jgi:hypothetical protein